MNTKKLANRLRTEIPSNLDDLDFLKSVYIKLAQDRVFDEKYYFGKRSTRRKIYKLAKKEKDNIATYEEKRIIICISLSYQIKHLMDELGYNCFVTRSFGNGDHVFPIIILSDGRNIKYDLQKDLGNIQTHCKTQYFGTSNEYDDYCIHNLYIIDEEEQYEIDKTIGYVNSKEEYKNSYIENLLKVIANSPNLTIWEKINTILSDPKVNDISYNAGYIETFMFYYRRLLPQFFTKKELSKKVHIITCSRSNKEDKNDIEYTNCIYVDDTSAPKAVYMFSRVYNKYILTPFDNLIKLQDKGLIIGNKCHNNGANKLKKQLSLYEKEKLESKER